MKLIAGKQKAWVSAAVAFGGAMALQRLGVGAGPTADQVTTLISLSQEIAVALVNAAIAGVLVYRTPNRQAGN